MPEQKIDKLSSGIRIPKTIHFAIRKEPSTEQADIIKRATELHPGWSIRIWQDDSPFPDSPLTAYLSRCQTGAQRADIVRLLAVFEEGGIYLDSDMRVLRSLDSLAQSSSFFIGSEDGYNLTNACFGATPHHPALQSLIDFLAENEPDWDLPPNVTTGPVLFAKVLRWRTDVCIYPRETFYPYHHYHPIRKAHRLSYCEHLWAGSWTSDWTWTGSKYERVGSTQAHPSRQKRTLRPLAKRALGGAVRPLIDALGRAVVRHSPRPLPSYSATDKIVVSTIHGHQLVAHGADYSLTPRLVRDGYFELGCERFVARSIQGGDWFIDVGANIGLYSLIAAAKCGPFGRVFAFEPNPRVAELLMESAALNWFHDRLSVYKTAVSDTSGKKHLHVLPGRSGETRIVDNGRANPDADGAFAITRQYLPNEEVIEVDSNMLDALFPVDLPIKFLKIDAEGHEASILAGARRLLHARSFQHVMIEAIPDAGLRQWKSTFRALSELVEYGYDVATVDEDGNLMQHLSLGAALQDMKDNNLVFSVSK